MLDDAERRARRHDAMGWIIAALFRRKRFIAGATAAAAIVAVVISLLLPNWYQGSARVLIPDSGGPMSGLLGNLPPQAAMLLGGGAMGNYTRYLAILTSNSVTDRVIEEFDLVEVYDTGDRPFPLTATRQELRSNTSFEVDRQYDFLTIAVLDKDPERAASMANFFVDELNRRNADLASQSAANYRRYVEQRRYEVVARLDSAQLAMQLLQEQIGVVELPSTAEAFMRGTAEQRARLVQLEIQHSALASQYGPENPRVIAAREALSAARTAERSAFEGRDPLLPIGMANLPAAVNQYASAYRDVLMQTELLKLVQPLYEQARFEEEREREAVQVVDRAAPPERKAKPFRALIVVSATLSVLLLSVLLVLGMAWVRRDGAVLWRAIRSSDGAA